MKTMTVTLGIQFSKWLPAGEPRQLTVGIDDEFTPDDVFRACNRISDLPDDLANLNTGWQQKLRFDLDANEYPSMSVEDTIHVESIGTWTCTSRGWAFIPADRTLPL